MKPLIYRVYIPEKKRFCWQVSDMPRNANRTLWLYAHRIAQQMNKDSKSHSELQRLSPQTRESMNVGRSKHHPLSDTDFALIERHAALRIVLDALAKGSLDQTQLRALQDALDVSYATPEEIRTLLALRDPKLEVIVQPKSS